MPDRAVADHALTVTVTAIHLTARARPTAPRVHFEGASVEKVDTAIENGIHTAELTGRPIRTSVARLIAPRIADSGDSALARLGRTGRLRRPDVLVELEWLCVPARHQASAGALWDYLDQPAAYRRQVRRAT